MLRVVEQLMVMDHGDASIFAYIADGILQGELPYRDRWDHKGPVLWALFVLMRVISTEWYGFFSVTISILLAILGLMFLTSRHLFGTPIAIFVVAVVLIAISVIGLQGNPRFYALLFQVLAIYVMVRANGSPRPWQAVIIGISGGFAFMIVPNAIGVWIAIGAYWAVSRKRSWKSTVWSSIGGLGVLLIISLILVTFGIWHDFYNAHITYNVAYSRHSHISGQRDIETILSLVRALPLQSTIPAVVAWIILFYVCLTSKLTNPVFKFLLFLAPIELILTLASTRGFYSYSIPLIPIVGLLSGFLVDYVLKSINVRSVVVSLALLVATTSWYIDHSVYNTYVDTLIKNGGNLNLRYGVNGQHHPWMQIIRDNTVEDDTIFVWAQNSTHWYNLTGTKAPIRHASLSALRVEGYLTQEKLNEHMQKIIDSNPSFIIESKMTFVQSLDASDHRWGALDLGDLLEFVQANYRTYAVDKDDVLRVRNDIEYLNIGGILTPASN